MSAKVYRLPIAPYPKIKQLPFSTRTSDLQFNAVSPPPIKSFSRNCRFLPPAQVVRQEGNVLTCVCPSVCPRRWGVGGTPARSRWGYPSQVQMVGRGTPRYLPPGQDRYPSLLARSGWGYPKAGGTPPSPKDRTAYGVLDTRWAVCFLRSGRRTFLSYPPPHPEMKT